MVIVNILAVHCPESRSYLEMNCVVSANICRSISATVPLFPKGDMVYIEGNFDFIWQSQFLAGVLTKSYSNPMSNKKTKISCSPMETEFHMPTNVINHRRVQLVSEHIISLIRITTFKIKEASVKYCQKHPLVGNAW